MRQWTLLTALFLLPHLAHPSYEGTSFALALPSSWSSSDATLLEQELTPPPIPPKAPRPAFAALPPMRTTPPWSRPFTTYSAPDLSSEIANAVSSAASPSTTNEVRLLVQPVNPGELSNEKVLVDPLENDWDTLPAELKLSPPDGRRHFHEQQTIAAMSAPSVIITDASLGSLIDLSLRLLPCLMHGTRTPQFIIVSGGHPFLRAGIVGALLDDMEALTEATWQRPMVLVGSAHPQGDDKDDFEAMHTPLRYKMRDRRRLIADSKNKSYLAGRVKKTQGMLTEFLLRNPRAVVLLQTAATDLVPFLEKVKDTQSDVQVWATGFVSEDVATQQWVSGANAKIDLDAARALWRSSVQRYIISESTPATVPKSMPMAAHPTLQRFYHALMEYSPTHRPLLDLFAQALEFANVPLDAFTTEKHAPITSAKANALSGAFYRLLPSQIQFPLAGLDAFPFTHGATRDHTFVQHYIEQRGSKTISHEIEGLLSTKASPIFVSILLVHPGLAPTLYMVDKLLSFVQARAATSGLSRRDSVSPPIAKSVPSDLLLAKAREALLQDAKLSDKQRGFIASLVSPSASTEGPAQPEEEDDMFTERYILQGMDPEEMKEEEASRYAAEREKEEARQVEVVRRAKAASPSEEEEERDINPLQELIIQLEADNHLPRPIDRFEVSLEGDDRVDRDFEASCLFSDASLSRPPLRVPPASSNEESKSHVRPPLHSAVTYPPLRASSQTKAQQEAEPQVSLPFHLNDATDESAIEDVLEEEEVEVAWQRCLRDRRRSGGSVWLPQIDPALLHVNKEDDVDALRAHMMSRSKSEGTATMHALVPQFHFTVDSRPTPSTRKREEVSFSTDAGRLLNPRHSYRSREWRPVSDDNIVHVKRPLSADAHGYLGEAVKAEEGASRKRARTF